MKGLLKGTEMPKYQLRTREGKDVMTRRVQLDMDARLFDAIATMAEEADMNMTEFMEMITKIFITQVQSSISLDIPARGY